MRRGARLAATLACLAGALAAHETFCEWRTVAVPAELRAAERARTILAIRETAHAAGNADEWDRADAALRAYDRDWLACYRAARGETAPGSPLAACLDARPYTIVGRTAEAVALAECERELHGALPEAPAIEACLRGRGHAEAPLPRWGFERLGPRFTGPWSSETALFAERAVAGVPISRRAAVVGGIAMPALLVALAFRLALSRAR